MQRRFGRARRRKLEARLPWSLQENPRLSNWLDFSEAGVVRAFTAKVELVMRADSAARSYDPRIKEVRASYADELRHILVVGS